MVSVKVTNENFQKLIVKRAGKLIGLANGLSHCQSHGEILTRPFLGEFLSQAVQIEELIDAYDAGNNCRWCAFRALTAAIKLFSNVSYELLHIRHALPAYHLLPIKGDFVKATNDALEFTGRVLRKASEQIINRASQLELPVPQQLSDKSYSEELPVGRLPRDCSARKVERVSETVTLLATAFLNLAADSASVRSALRAKPQEYAFYLSSEISEEKLRSLELRFHNLQSLYDTFVSGTEAADIDKDLPVLRGHISVVLHLLRIATLFAHYYERHVCKPTCNSPERLIPLVEPQRLLSVLMNYSITHISLYIGCAERLCQEMLKRYAEVGQLEVSVPQYRGFHVRPSTLISKLVLHYGSEVKMQLDNDFYDAGKSLELFRANEKINARKRRWLAEEVVRLQLAPQRKEDEDINSIVRSVVLILAGQSKLILYEQPLQLPQQPTQREGTLVQQITDEMAELLAVGKIDVKTDMTATFIGDKRVLADIKLLAEAGYGEDNFGNNIPLPEKLVYLR